MKKGLLANDSVIEQVGSKINTTCPFLCTMQASKHANILLLRQKHGL
jgi:hypothetical protein